MSPRILIAGGPKAGKTTLANGLAAQGGVTLLHTDDLIDTHDWSSASDEVASWMSREGPWVIEGVAVPRALRKWLQANPEGMPCELALWLSEPKERLTLRQSAMAKGCLTVWREVEQELRRRGVELRAL